MINQTLLRQIPSMDKLLSQLKEVIFFDIDETILKQVTSDYLDQLRHQIRDGQIKSLSSDEIVDEILLLLENFNKGKIKPLINGTGIIVHTNLGRSIYSETVLESAFSKLRTYNNLEFDLSTGKRGERYGLVESLICHLTGAESAIVVNNNAAAVLLILSALAQNKKVLLSRGECVEIGGSFRLPDVMRLSGSQLHEVGTTNKTHLSDYQMNVDDETAMILKVHTSNYKVVGFTSEVEMATLANMRQAFFPKLILYEDLGSGQLIETDEGEPTVRASLSAGADLVSFSGDKLLGGPQAGIIVGQKALIDQLKTHPLLRALRIDKASLVLLETTLLEYIKKKSHVTIPTQRYMHRSPQAIKACVQSFIEAYQEETSLKLSLQSTQSQVGGGSLPLKSYDSYALKLEDPHHKLSANQMHERLRQAQVPVIGRIQANTLFIDFRTIETSAFSDLLRAIKTLEVEHESE